MSNEEIENEIISIEAMAKIMLERCSKWRRELRGTATSSAPKRRKKKPLSREQIEHVLNKRRLQKAK